jgi:hypothetical protein
MGMDKVALVDPASVRLGRDGRRVADVLHLGADCSDRETAIGALIVEDIIIVDMVGVLSPYWEAGRPDA